MNEQSNVHDTALTRSERAELLNVIRMKKDWSAWRTEWAAFVLGLMFYFWRQDSLAMVASGVMLAITMAGVATAQARMNAKRLDAVAKLLDKKLD